MKVWQGCLLAFGVFVLFVGAIIGVVFWATGGIVDVADEFFAAAYEGDYDNAHSLTSQRLQEQGSPEALERFLTEQGLDKVTETSWSSRNIQNSQGSLEGTVTTESGANIPILVELVSENDEWRISFIEPQRVGMQTSGPGMAGAGNGTRPGPPGRSAIDPDAAYASTGRWLISASGLIGSWADNDYGWFASSWRDGTEAADLAARYPRGDLTDEEIEQLEDVRPVLESARFNEDGNIELALSITIPSRVVRTLFTYEPGEPGQPPGKILDLEVDYGG
ncbi:MAG: nuclear transport factor 2 family protein [Erythrobacter sp.]